MKRKLKEKGLYTVGSFKFKLNKLKMTLNDRSDLITELTVLSDSAQGAAIDINSSQVKNTGFYKEIQQTEELNINCCSLLPKVLVLIARIAATSSAIRAVSIINSNLAESGVAVAEALAKSSTIDIVNISGNYLGEDGPAIAEALAKSPTIRDVNISTNILTKYGPDVARALARSPKIQVVDISFNGLDRYGLDVAKALVESFTIQSIDMSFNGLDRYGLDVAKTLIKSNSIFDVRMVGNVLDQSKISTISTFFEKHNNEVDYLNQILYTHEILPLPFSLLELTVDYIGHHHMELVL